MNQKGRGWNLPTAIALGFGEIIIAMMAGDLTPWLGVAVMSSVAALMCGILAGYVASNDAFDRWLLQKLAGHRLDGIKGEDEKWYSSLVTIRAAAAERISDAPAQRVANDIESISWLFIALSVVGVMSHLLMVL